jgi:predicted DNA-binding transcriptional regulator YafY
VRADRLISLLMLLQTRGQMTAQELAERLEVSPRTIYRDLDALSAAGVPVYAERGPHGGCALLESYRTNLTGLKEDEVRALFMFSVPGLLADLGADKASEAALLKLSAALPAPFQRDAELVRRRIYLDPTGWFQFEEATPHLSTIQTALWGAQRLRIVYRSAAGNWSKQLVDPYGLIAKAGVWYMVGSVNGYIATYRISRMAEASPTGSSFDYPEDFDLAAYWSDWCARFEASRQTYAVTLRIAPNAAPMLVRVLGEGVYHMIERVETVAEDGSFLLELQFDSAETACQKVLGLGDSVRIVEPVALRRQVVDAARQLLLHHANTDDERWAVHAVGASGPMGDGGTATAGRSAGK